MTDITDLEKWAAKGGAGEPQAETLPCIVCGKELENACGVKKSDELKFGFCNQPFGGLAFHTLGHYRSTIFDPMRDGIRMEISVCDECIRKNKDKLTIIHKTRDNPKWHKLEDMSTEADL